MHEDSDQRLLRYKKEGRRVPIEWRGYVTETTTLHPDGASVPATAINPEDFVPTGKEADLWEILDPTEPIGFIGNYAVFAIRPLSDFYSVKYSSEDLREHTRQGEIIISINETLGAMIQPYINPDDQLRTATLLDPARAFFEQEAEKVHPNLLKTLNDEQVYDFLSYLPKLASKLLDQNGNIVRTGDILDHQISSAEWGEYLYRKNNTRRFLVDSNNLYLNIRVSGGAALEPFKRAHRHLDVLRAAEEANAERLKNARRANQVDSEKAFDPDIEKVVIMGNGANPVAVMEALGEDQPAEGSDSEEPITP
jgi:hypothetical protein